MSKNEWTRNLIIDLSYLAIASGAPDGLKSIRRLGIMNLFKNKINQSRDKFELLFELVEFLWQYKLWWMIPIIIVMVAFTSMILFVQSTGLAPFIYPLF